MAGAIFIGDRRYSIRPLATLGRCLASTVSLMALTLPETLLAQPAPGSPDVNIPEVRVIATTPTSSSSPRRAAPAGTTTPRPARAPARGRAPAAPVTPVAAPVDPTVIDRDKVPSNTQSLTSADFTRTASPNVTDTLFERVPAISISDPNGNGVQQEIKYRGFSASPTQGSPQGLAIYMGGIRLNEAFGDTVNFDLIPTNAIDRADVWSNNPLFGLNALGGAISLSMKNGFTYQGTEAEIMGGSFGRAMISAQTGWNNGSQSLYLSGQGMHDDGWRQKSDANVGRFYGDVGFRDDRTEVHGILAAAHTAFGVAAATPIQMLQRDWTSIFTTPQTTDNQMFMAGANAKHALTDTWTLQGNVYYRNFQQKHVDGNDGDFERCSGNAANPLFNTLCLQDDNFPAQPKANFQILGANNQPIPCPPAPGNQGCNITPYGTIDRTQTKTNTVGGSLQATDAEKLFGHDNRFVVGTSIDRSEINFNASSELDFIFPNLVVGPNPNVPGLGQIIHTAGNIGYAPVSLKANTTYFGVYATDTFDITRELSATLGARLNVAKLSMADQLGTSPELNSSPTYSRINPLAGLTYKAAPWLNFFGGYSESNRAPTPLELGCASSTKPCLIEGFLVADPPLKQVVGKTFEGGLRGIVDTMPGRLEYKLAFFRTDSFDDILQVASTIPGRGFFTNVQQERRQGFEASVDYRNGPLSVYAGYSYIDATFQFTGDIASPNNPSADGDGNVHVTPGKHIPMIPLNQFKAGADYAVTPAWTVGGSMLWVGSRWFEGDPANQNEKLPAYSVFNLRTSYQVTKNVQVFGLVNNLFNKKYALFGTYFGPDGVQNAGTGFNFTDNRTEVPGQPLSIYVGLRAKL
jgi:iron complex outermembrane receptor protein